MVKRYLCALIAASGMIFSASAFADVIDSTGAGFSIPDDSAAGISSTITIGADETISNLEISLFNLTHTWVGDLIGQLSSPDGTTADLFFRLGPGGFGDGSNLNGNYTFADGGANFRNAATSIGGGATVAPGTYEASTNGDGAVSLAAAFGGESTQGDWTLTISDNAGQDTGSLGGWGLNINSAVTAVPEPGPWMLVVMSGLAYVKRRHRNA